MEGMKLKILYVLRRWISSLKRSQSNWSFDLKFGCRPSKSLLISRRLWCSCNFRIFCLLIPFLKEVLARHRFCFLSKSDFCCSVVFLFRYSAVWTWTDITKQHYQWINDYPYSTNPFGKAYENPLYISNQCPWE